MIWFHLTKEFHYTLCFTCTIIYKKYNFLSWFWWQKSNTCMVKWIVLYVVFFFRYLKSWFPLTENHWALSHLQTHGRCVHSSPLILWYIVILLCRYKLILLLFNHDKKVCKYYTMYKKMTFLNIYIKCMSVDFRYAFSDF